MFHEKDVSKKDPDEIQERLKAKIRRGETNFDGYVLPRLNMDGESFEKDVSFRNMKVKGNATFRNTTFKGRAKFAGVTFQDWAYFTDAVFEGLASFADAAFRVGDFRVKKFGSEVRFRFARFLERGSFDYVEFKSCTFAGTLLNRVSFMETDLKNVVFGNADLGEALLAEAKWPEKYVIREEREAKSVEGLTKAEMVYRNIKRSLENEGAYRLSGDFLYREMLVREKRFRMEERWSSWFASLFFRGICGYGEKPWRIVITSVLTILLFSLFYAFNYTTIYAPQQVASTTLADFVQRAVTALYISTGAFTSLGYEGYQIADWVKPIAALESFMGAFLMAVFVLVFARKMMR